MECLAQSLKSFGIIGAKGEQICGFDSVKMSLNTLWVVRKLAKRNRPKDPFEVMKTFETTECKGWYPE
jgi:hypothetical protein